MTICLSYLEGVEQYRNGNSSDQSSKRIFTSALDRIYPNQFRLDDLKRFYEQARCGLFHDGMVRGMILFNKQYEQVLEFEGSDIKVNHIKFLVDIRIGFFKLYIRIKNR